MKASKQSASDSIVDFPELAVSTANILKPIFINDQPADGTAIHAIATALLDYLETCPHLLKTGTDRDLLITRVEQSYHALYLCDMLYLSNEAIPAAAFRDWLDTHTPYDSDAGAVASMAQKRPLESDYWDHLQHLVIRGAVDEALALIRSVYYTNEDLKTLENVLAQYPADATPTSRQLRFWQDTVRQVSKDAVSRAAREVLAVLRGDVDAIKDHAKSTWLEKFSAVLHYRGGTPFDHLDVLREFVEGVDLTDEDQLVLDLLLNEPESAIESARSVWLWLATHLSVLMSAAGVLDFSLLSPKTGDDSAVSLVEQVTMEYADAVFYTGRLYHVAYWYYEVCPQRGLECLEKAIVCKLTAVRDQYIKTLAEHVRDGTYRLDECHRILEFFKPLRDDIWAQLSQCLAERYKSTGAHHDAIRTLANVVVYAGQQESAAIAQLGFDADARELAELSRAMKAEALNRVRDDCHQLLYDALESNDFSDILPFEDFSDEERTAVPIVAYLSAFSSFLGVDEECQRDPAVCQVLHQLLISAICPTFLIEYLLRVVAGILSSDSGALLFTGAQLDDISARLAEYEGVVVPFARAFSSSPAWPHLSRVHTRYDPTFCSQLHELLLSAEFYRSNDVGNKNDAGRGGDDGMLGDVGSSDSAMSANSPGDGTIRLQI
ncbi:hypothetical protein RI367_001243 [Sorochytrium milnesiophthora]